MTRQKPPAMIVMWGRKRARRAALSMAASSSPAAPGLRLRTAAVSERSHEGRHTTTQVNLLPLEIGGYVVDTPGIREFGVSGLARGELIRYYPEMAEAAGHCRFRDCSHLHEPGCAVIEAVRLGRVSKARYHNYEKIYADL